MAKMPANMVKAPKFDNPIRRTSKPELAVVEEPGAVALPEFPVAHRDCLPRLRAPLEESFRGLNSIWPSSSMR